MGGAEPGAQGDDLVGHLALSADPESVGRARRFLRGFLGDDVSPDALANAELCLSEIATNALVHSHGTYELRVTLDGMQLTVAVRDRGQSGAQTLAEPAAPEDDPLEISGRGLQLVEALADRWGSERDALGTIVWFSLDLRSASSEASG